MVLPRRVVLAYRLGFGALTVAAIGTQFLHSAQRPGFNPINFFSFFTNLGNLLGAIVFLVCGLSERFARSRVGELARGAAASYLLIVFVVYWLLLSGITESLGILIPWVNKVVHTIMPIVAIGDWIIAPATRPLPRRALVWWLAFPLGFFLYSMVRGASVGWYPYPFLNPATAGGLRGVAGYFVAITLGFCLAIAITAWIAHRRHGRAAADQV